MQQHNLKEHGPSLDTSAVFPARPLIPIFKFAAEKASQRIASASNFNQLAATPVASANPKQCPNFQR
jgi:hypothetical protein